jgi:CBS domain-containing protein
MKKNESIKTIMTPAPTTVHLGMKLSEVRRRLAEGHYHHVPVVDGQKLVGMLSSTDFLRLAFTEQMDERQLDAILDHTSSIAAAMTKNLVTITPTDTVRKATEMLAEASFHALPVVDNDKNLVGIVTTTDLLRYLLAQY